MYVTNSRKTLMKIQQTSVVLDDSDEVVPSVRDHFDQEVFIEAVRVYPCLWNTSVASYKDQTKKKRAWQQIKAALGGVYSGMYCSFLYVFFFPLCVQTIL